MTISAPRDGDDATVAERASGAGADPVVLSLGETLIDFIAADGDGNLETATEFGARMGGAPANVAVALARLGTPSAFCGVVGADAFGEKLRRGLAAEGVDVARLRGTAERPTTFAFAWKDRRGDGHFWLIRAADVLLSPVDAEAAGIANARALVVGSVALAEEPSRSAIYRAVELANAAGVPVCFDVNLRPTLWPDLDQARTACQPVFDGATVVKLSLDDARGLFGAGAEPERSVSFVVGVSAARIVVLTDGERGSWFLGEGDEVGFCPAFTVAAVEPTGAGDAFTAALVTRLAEYGWRRPTLDDVRWAAAAGALATTRRGAWEGLPTAQELATFVDSAGR